MIHELTQQEKKRVFNHRLQRIHVALGISFSFLMYVALFFGVFAILLPYIQNWENPTRHIKIINSYDIDYDKIITPILNDKEYPKINPITISLPGYMKDPTVKVSTKFVQAKIFNPIIYEEIPYETTHFKLAQFLNYMHYGRVFGEFGWYVFGFTAVAGIILIVGGLYQILQLQYKNRVKTPAGFFSKWHRKILIWTMTPFFIITISAVFMNLGKKTAPLMTSIATKGETHQVGKFIFPVLHPQDQRVEKLNRNTPMLSINQLLKKAHQVAPDLNFYRMKLTNWNDVSAVVKFEGYHPYLPFFNGISNQPNITLSGVDGHVIKQTDVFDRSWGVIFYDVINYIHLLFNVDDITRSIVVILMLLTTLAIGFGNLLYLDKKAKKFPASIPVYQGLGKLSLAVMVGVLPATGLLFFLQWALPMDLHDKSLYQKGMFSVLWVGTLTWSFYRINSYQAAKEFLYLGGLLFLSSSVIHFIKSEFDPIRLFKEEVYSVLAMDVILMVFGLVLIVVATKLPLERKKMSDFWMKKALQ